ncbi:hemerythrin domain-containing protein [Actinospica sp. MGRD01-02]|uniref:Hemerythrin domain-containing protein n=1 Tax=Actinospica acidithermotolerans TaxID=2828514 RepID=A0A941IKN8_9ACTN|nr:hemerythrin domain-containing protein [Actinospica acidithermotolerans]MBR7829122.1 hemerythrin domain-containing protein [Actinospica acidithermotolerans]
MSLMGEADNERARAERLPEGSVIAVLLAQHARIREQFAAVQVAPPAQRQEPFDRLREMLAVHEAAEEIVVRPVSRKDAGAQIAAARNDEEKQAAKVLAEMEGMDSSSDEFAARLNALAAAVSEHAEHEETEEFPALQNAHTDQELAALGEKLLKAERTAPTHPHPSTAGSPMAQRVAGPFAAMLDRARDSYRS